MRIMTIVAMAAVVTMSARAGQKVIVCVHGSSVVPIPVLYQAQGLAKKMFAGVAVEIAWCIGKPSHSQSQRGELIVIDTATGTPKELQPNALAVALPYEGVHITVFYDRVQRLTDPQLTPKVLAHVLVHEITHVLQGTCLHSETGVMKAHWTGADYNEMQRRPLSFTAEDAQLIRFGLAKRAESRTRVSGSPSDQKLYFTAN